MVRFVPKSIEKCLRTRHSLFHSRCLHKGDVPEQRLRPLEHGQGGQSYLGSPYYTNILSSCSRASLTHLWKQNSEIRSRSILSCHVLQIRTPPPKVYTIYPKTHIFSFAFPTNNALLFSHVMDLDLNFFLKNYSSCPNGSEGGGALIFRQGLKTSKGLGQPQTLTNREVQIKNITGKETRRDLAGKR